MRDGGVVGVEGFCCWLITGALRESREQHQQRRQMQQEQRQREHALELTRLLALQNSSAK